MVKNHLQRLAGINTLPVNRNINIGHWQQQNNIHGNLVLLSCLTLSAFFQVFMQDMHIFFIRMLYNYAIWK